MTTFFSHLLVLPDSVQLRDYQATIAKEALGQNTLVILPTGLGKTVVSLIVMASRLTGDQKVILVAPTKPLCEQHYHYFEKHLPYTAVRLLTGELPATERLKEWFDAQVIIGTPQTIENDLKMNAYNLRDVSLLVIDEAHRAVGGYAYTFIAGEYQATSQNPLILAMTASPGGDEEKVNAIKNALNISQVINKDETDPEIMPYLHGKDIQHIYLDLPETLKDIVHIMRRVMRDRTMVIRQMNIRITELPSMGEINRLRGKASEMIAQRDGTGYQLASILAEIMKLRHAIMIAETQGMVSLRKYFVKLLDESNQEKPVKSSKSLTQDELFSKVFQYVLKEGNEEIHPKPRTLTGIVERELGLNPDSKILIFANFRDMGSYLVSLLQEQGIEARHFTGQSKRSETDKGMSQKKQVQAIEAFRNSEFRVLVATSVGEEGLDIPSTDLVIFYEPVPSEVRSIQRRGRTGRFADGKVIILITQETQDEINYFAAKRKEQAMKTMDHTTRQGVIV